ncbi:phage major capsid protein [Erysipelotrichaceae bacterium OttesenSCG-928-M19]|nr:phage major capsid protein [Erysipelotrichaceae bacterium OttesenSCG-928-M19]
MGIIELNKKRLDLGIKKEMIKKEKETKLEEQKSLKETDMQTKSVEELEEIKNKLENIVSEIEVITSNEEALDEEITETDEEINKYYIAAEELKKIGKEGNNLRTEKEKLLEVTKTNKYMEVLGKSLRTQDKRYVKEFLEQEGLSEKMITTATEGSGNGGILIPQYVADKIQTKIKDVGNLLATLNKTEFKGDIELPIEVAGIEAFIHEEDSDKRDSTPDFGTIAISVDFIYAKVVVTTKMEALDNGSLATYLMDKLPEAVISKIESLVIYGEPTDKIQGIKTADSKFVTTIGKIASNDTVLEAMETVKNATTVYMNRLTWVRNFMKLRTADGQRLEEINYSFAEPSVWGLKVEYVEAMAIGEAVVGNGSNYTLNLPLGTGVSVDRSEVNKHKNNTISYLPEVLTGGAPSTLDGFAYITGVVTP